MEPVRTHHEEHAPLADRLIAPYFRDAALWPVTLVLLVHVVLGIAVGVLAAWRSGAGFALAWIGALALLSVAAWLRDARAHRFGLASRTLAGSWLVGLVCAVVADRWAWY